LLNLAIDYHPSRLAIVNLIVFWCPIGYPSIHIAPPACLIAKSIIAYTSHASPQVKSSPLHNANKATSDRTFHFLDGSKIQRKR
jgi:hypothetical protein